MKTIIVNCTLILSHNYQTDISTPIKLEEYSGRKDSCANRQTFIFIYFFSARIQQNKHCKHEQILSYYWLAADPEGLNTVWSQVARIFLLTISSVITSLGRRYDITSWNYNYDKVVVWEDSISSLQFVLCWWLLPNNQRRIKSFQMTPHRPYFCWSALLNHFR